MSQFGDEESRKAWKKGKLDSNGYAESLLATERGFCFYCQRQTECARHEIFYGNGRRKLSKEDGLWCYLCPKCHDFEHDYKLVRNGETLMQTGQRAYERNHTREEFMKRYGRNYL